MLGTMWVDTCSLIGGCIHFLLLLGQLPQIYWLETTQMYYLTILEIRRPTRVCRVEIEVLAAGLCSFLDVLEKNLFSCLLQCLEAAYTVWPLAPFLRLQSQECRLSDLSSSVMLPSVLNWERFLTCTDSRD